MADKQWLPPPGNTAGLKSEAIAMPGKKGAWRWKEIEHTPKQEAKRKRFFKTMKEADQNDETSFDY